MTLKAAAPALAMIGGCALAAVIVALVATRDTSVAAVCGMLAPLASTVATWWLVDQTFRHAPERLTGMMVAAFGGKMLFFAGYLAVMLKGLRLATVPFVASFTTAFIALHLSEALLFRRLFAGPRPGQPAAADSR